MRRSFWLPVVLAAIAGLSVPLGCYGRGSGTGQPWYGPGTGPIGSFIPGGSIGGANATEYVYWVNNKTNDIAIYAIDSQSGCITPTLQNNISTGTGPRSIQAYPDLTKRLMYVGCDSGDILPYFVDPQGSGNLTPAATSQNVASLGQFVSMKFRGDGAFLYILTNATFGGSGGAAGGGGGAGGGQQQSSAVLTSFAIDPSTGALNPPANQAGKQIQPSIQVAPPAPGLKAFALAIDPNNQFAYVALSDNRVVALGLDNDGSITIVTQTASTQNWITGIAEPICLISYQNYLYESGLVSSDLDFMQAQQGQLSLSQSTYATGGQLPVAMTIPLTGGFLFTCNNQSGDISQFTLGSANGVLGPSPPPPPLVGGAISNGAVANAANLVALAINFGGTFAYALDNQVSPNPAQISCYTITGGLLAPATPPQAPPAGPGGPIGAGYSNVQTQKGGAQGASAPNPDAIIVSHIN